MRAMSPDKRATSPMPWTCMIPHFQSDGVSLYRGDALAVLSMLHNDTVDAVLTDPPYSSGGVTLGARQADPAQKYQSSGTKRQYPPMLGDSKDQHSWIMWCTLWLGECWRIAREGAPLMVFTLTGGSFRP